MSTELSKKLEDVADVLEKTAVYLGEVEASEKVVELEKEASFKEKTVDPVLEKVSSILDTEDIDDSLKEKLASTDPQVLATLLKVAEKVDKEESPTLGEPANENIKLASASDDDADPLLAFCLD